jgi:hypothetical protein
VLSHALRLHIDTLVETGTYMGQMVDAQKGFFKTIYSIELSTDLHARAVKKFRRYDHIRLIQGDSGERLAEIVDALTGPALFWLDGHYSGGITALGSKECPIIEELGHILRSRYSHTVLIDDARLFVGGEYPTIAELERLLGVKLPVENDIVVWQKQ